MPYYHCRKCQHEFEAIPFEGEILKCDWCGADEPRVLEDKTPLEKMCDNWEPLLERLQDGSICERERDKPDSTELRRKGRRGKDISEG